eukprot:scaffold7644_cov325-Pinguiococcus_pyrenoidosus.AAC.1
MLRAGSALARTSWASGMRSARLSFPQLLQRLSTGEGKEQMMEEKLQKALAATAGGTELTPHLALLAELFHPHARYAVEVVSPEFAGKKLVQQHKMVTEVLKEDISDMHGLTLKTSAK